MQTNEIFKYQIRTAYNPQDLTELVQEYIKDGWEPHGSLVVQRFQDNMLQGSLLHQPMVKYVNQVKRSSCKT